jgi:hypothetical protein
MRLVVNLILAVSIPLIQRRPKIQISDCYECLKLAIPINRLTSSPDGIGQCDGDCIVCGPVGAVCELKWV